MAARGNIAANAAWPTRVRSVLTHRVKAVVAAEASIHAVFPAEQSGQLPFSGLELHPMGSRVVLGAEGQSSSAAAATRRKGVSAQPEATFHIVGAAETDGNQTLAWREAIRSAEKQQGSRTKSHSAGLWQRGGDPGRQVRAPISRRPFLRRRAASNQGKALPKGSPIGCVKPSPNS